MVGNALVHTRRKTFAPSHLNITNSEFQLQICSSWEHQRALGSWNVLAEVGEDHSNNFAAVREGSEVTDIQNVRIFPLKHVAHGHEVEE